LLLGQTPSLTFNDVWPQWRGPAGNSVALGGGFPTHWSKAENIVWKTAISGWGNSTPAIWQDTLFLTSQDDERLLLLSIDRATGKILWQREVATGKPRRQGPVGNGRFHDEQNMATPSPVTDGRHVWAHFGTGELACYDFAGGKKWATNLSRRFGPYTIWWGHANSPLLVDDLLISVCIQDPKGGGPSYVVAHDKETGQEKWLTHRVTGATEEPADSYTTPLLYRAGGHAEVIVFGGNVLDAYDPATGHRLWQCTAFKGNRVISGPTLAGDTVFAIQGMKGPLFAIQAGAADDDNNRVRWKYAGATPDAASPLVAGGLVFLINNSGVAFCLDAQTGRQVWKERLGGEFRASPLFAGGNVYFLSKEGKATIVAASREFQVVGQADLGEQIIASPAAVRGNLYIRTKQHLFRIGEKNKNAPL
jgi:outer membrane protein assembly factor BamB